MVENSPTITKDESRKSDQLWCGNKSTINIANNSIQHDRTKHIEIDKFKEKLDCAILKLSHVSTEDQVAYCLTKGLALVSLSRLCDKMGFVDNFRPSRGGVLRMIKVIAKRLASPNNYYPNDEILAFIKRNLILV